MKPSSEYLLNNYYFNTVSTVNSKLSNDLEVLILAQPITNVPICKIASSADIDRAEQGLIVGRSNSMIGVGVKRQAIMSIKTNSSLYACNSYLELLALPISQTELSDGCLGDSGGPIYINSNNE